ncbi:flagellar basal-body MS-ring/collar protein FliF [Agaribacter flavus]|uniref:Flagellar M-ring protein n=1 Tax=Agaribacter flavus TaxID=1902781 RepID=A0ABV7FQB2_9ALTE
MTEVLNAMDSKKRLSFFVLMGVGAVLFLAAVVWILSPKYSPVLEGLDEQTAAAAIAKLDEQGVIYSLAQTANGTTLMVDQEIAEKLRVTLSESLGLPDVQGLELFDNADYSMTDFSQDVTYKRAIQGELARTISSMPGIKSARVHITFAPKRLFSENASEAKASVYLEQHTNFSITDEQVVGIKRLVANAVDKMLATNVAIFDTSGAELNSPDEQGLSASLNKKYEAKLQVERVLTEKAFRILSLFVPADSIAISVDASLNFDQKRKTTQGFATGQDGQGLVVREKESRVSAQPSNDEEEQSIDVSLSQERETEYRHGQETEETVFSAGEIESLSVGIAINADLNEAQLNKLRQVLAAGMGINLTRGDTFALEVLDIANPPVESQLFEDSQLLTDTELEHAAPSNVEKVDTGAVIQNKPVYLLSSNSNLILFLVLAFVVLSILTALGLVRHRALQKKKREKLLLEINEWLEQEDKAYV